MFDDEIERDYHEYSIGLVRVKKSDLTKLKKQLSYELFLRVKGLHRGVMTLSVEDLFGFDNEIPFRHAIRKVNEAVKELSTINVTLYYQKVGSQAFLFSWDPFEKQSSEEGN